MSKVKKIIIGLIASFFFTSCIITHQGNVSSGPLLSITDRYVDVAKGEARSYLVFGLGRFRNDKLVLNAKKSLYKNRPLARNEYYSNFSTEISRKIILMVSINKVTVSADILKSNVLDTNFLFFNDKRVVKINKNNELDTNRLEKIGNKEFISQSIKEIHTGDSVYFYSTNSKKFNLYVVAEIDRENVLLKSTDKSIKNVLTALSSKFYFKRMEQHNFKNGDKVSIEIKDYNNVVNKFYEGKILGVTKKTVLVQTTDGNTYVIKPKLVKKIN